MLYGKEKLLQKFTINKTKILSRLNSHWKKYNIIIQKEIGQDATIQRQAEGYKKFQNSRIIISLSVFK